MKPALSAVSLIVFTLITGARAESFEGAGSAADQGPPMAFFTGVYEEVGRDAGKQPRLINRLIRLDAAEAKAGDRLELRLCEEAGPASKPAGYLMPAGDFMGEVTNVLSLIGAGGDEQVLCQYFTNHSNYPILTCVSQDGALRSTFWPVPDREEDCAAP